MVASYRPTVAQIAGETVITWERIPELARISPDYLEAVVFLYATEEDARMSAHTGGSGFIFMTRLRETESAPEDDEADLAHIYVATNRHVVAAGFSVVRISGSSIPTSIVRLDWVFHPDGDDVAISYLPEDIPIQRAIPFDDRILEEDEDRPEKAIWPGEDVFMTGRFIGLDQRVHNTPTARFGSLSIPTPERIKNRHTGLEQESLLVEMRSLPGYSGSPVFLMRTRVEAVPPRGLRFNVPVIWLLGIDWGHIDRYASVLEPVGDGAYASVPGGLVVRENSGMSAVVPVWKIAELLQEDELAKERRAAERRHKEEAESTRSAISADVEPRPEFTRETFLRDLRKVSRRKPSQSDEGTSGTSE
jgi:hypothetical protein